MATKEEWYQFKIRLLCIFGGFFAGLMFGIGIGLGG